MSKKKHALYTVRFVGTNTVLKDLKLQKVTGNRGITISDKVITYNLDDKPSKIVFVRSGECDPVIRVGVESFALTSAAKIHIPNKYIGVWKHGTGCSLAYTAELLNSTECVTEILIEEQ